MQNVLERPVLAAEAGKRDLNLDLIRCVATFFVVSVHFFMWIGFYYEPMVGRRMLVMSVGRMFFMSCVPLFLMLTGYLNCRKKWSPRYYLGIVRVLLTYVLCTFVCYGYRWINGEAVDLRALVKGLLEYNGAPYAWYIEMYIGLFLLTPFLNAAWNALEDRRQRRALVITLLALSSLPSLINLKVNILPDWWVLIYPLAYYTLGAAFRTDPPRLAGKWLALIFLLSVTVGGAAQFKLNEGGIFEWRALTDWNGITIVISAAALFALLRRVPTAGAPKWAARLLRKGSELSLGIYLVSWCFDVWFYSVLMAKWPGVPVTERLPWYFLAVPVVFLSSALTAQVVEWVRKGITLGLNKLFPKAGLK